MCNMCKSCAADFGVVHTDGTFRIGDACYNSNNCFNMVLPLNIGTHVSIPAYLYWRSYFIKSVWRSNTAKLQRRPGYHCLGGSSTHALVTRMICKRMTPHWMAKLAKVRPCSQGLKTCPPMAVRVYKHSFVLHFCQWLL